VNIILNFIILDVNSSHLTRVNNLFHLSQRLIMKYWMLLMSFLLGNRLLRY